MGETIRRVVDGVAYDIHLTLDRGGDGWVATVRLDNHLVGACTGTTRDVALQAVMLQLRVRGAVHHRLPLGLDAEQGLMVGECLRSARGKLPKRFWKEPG
ncbi:MAG: hypothetical protein HY319_02050 [Armatimonadetes bacterium]|nr:hypothetical protein [Armatimonadota bacterium]